MHEELIDRCNKVGCRVSDFLKAAIDFALHDHVEFDFGNDEDESEESKAEDSTCVYYLEQKGKSNKQEAIPTARVRLD